MPVRDIDSVVYMLIRCMILHSAVLEEEGTCLPQLELMVLLECLIFGKVNTCSQ